MALHGVVEEREVCRAVQGLLFELFEGNVKVSLGTA